MMHHMNVPSVQIGEMKDLRILLDVHSRRVYVLMDSILTNAWVADPQDAHGRLLRKIYQPPHRAGLPA